MYSAAARGCPEKSLALPRTRLNQRTTFSNLSQTIIHVEEEMGVLIDNFLHIISWVKH